MKSGVFIAYVGMYSYTVDAFATSTAWEYELFKTDDAIEAGSDLDIDAPEAFFDLQFDEKELDRLWPDAAEHAYRPANDWPGEEEQSA